MYFRESGSEVWYSVSVSVDSGAIRGVDSDIADRFLLLPISKRSKTSIVTGRCAGKLMVRGRGDVLTGKTLPDRVLYCLACCRRAYIAGPFPGVLQRQVKSLDSQGSTHPCRSHAAGAMLTEKKKLAEWNPMKNAALWSMNFVNVAEKTSLPSPEHTLTPRFQTKRK